MSIKVAFLGTPEFAVPALKKLARSEFKPAAVFCAPDKPVGRKQELTPPPVKVAAQELGIPVFQPANKAELAKLVAEQKPDLIISVAYGIIIPKEVLETPKYGCLNIHPSLLPKYRGASPIQTAILNGDEKTGVSIFKMDEGVDTGDVLIEREWSIDKKSAPELFDELAELGGEVLVKILPDWIAGKIEPKPQDNSEAILTKQIKKEDGQIDWKKSAEEIERQIRAFDPWPGTHTRIMNNESSIKDLKILKADASDKNYGNQPGEIFENIRRILHGHH